MGLGKREREFLRSLVGPRHWKEDEARQALSLLAASGMSRAGFAREFGMTTTRLAWWERRLTRDDGSPPPQVEQRKLGARFVELVTTPTKETAAARVQVGAVEVVLHRLDEAAAQFVVELARRHVEGPCS